MHKQYELIEALGITVVPVETLTAKAVLLEEHPIVLVRPDLSDGDHGRVVDWLLPRLTRRMTQTDLH